MGENVVANGAFVLVWHWRPNIEIGGGVALNNTFGYPKVFPAFYFKYNGAFSDKFTIEVGSINSIAHQAATFTNRFIPNPVKSMR